MVPTETIHRRRRRYFLAETSRRLRYRRLRSCPPLRRAPTRPAEKALPPTGDDMLLDIVPLFAFLFHGTAEDVAKIRRRAVPDLRRTGCSRSDAYECSAAGSVYYVCMCSCSGTNLVIDGVIRCGTALRAWPGLMFGVEWTMPPVRGNRSSRRRRRWCWRRTGGITMSWSDVYGDCPVEQGRLGHDRDQERPRWGWSTEGAEAFHRRAVDLQRGRDEVPCRPGP